MSAQTLRRPRLRLRSENCIVAAGPRPGSSPLRWPERCAGEDVGLQAHALAAAAGHFLRDVFGRGVEVGGGGGAVGCAPSACSVPVCHGTLGAGTVHHAVPVPRRLFRLATESQDRSIPSLDYTLKRLSFSFPEKYLFCPCFVISLFTHRPS